MEKRSEMKKVKKQLWRQKLKQAFAVAACLAFMASLIYMTDLSTRRMMMCKDDQYALGLKIVENHLLRVDVAGESFRFDISSAVKIKDTVLTQTKECGRQVSEYVKSKLE